MLPADRTRLNFSLGSLLVRWFVVQDTSPLCTAPKAIVADYFFSSVDRVTLQRKALRWWIHNPTSTSTTCRRQNLQTWFFLTSLEVSFDLSIRTNPFQAFPRPKLLSAPGRPTFAVMLFLLWLLFTPSQSYGLVIPPSSTATGTTGTAEPATFVATPDAENGDQLILGQRKRLTCNYVGGDGGK